MEKVAKWNNFLYFLQKFVNTHRFILILSKKIEIHGERKKKQPSKERERIASKL